MLYDQTGVLIVCVVLGYFSDRGGKNRTGRLVKIHYTDTDTDTATHTHAHTRTHARTHARTHTRTHTHTHTHTHTIKNKYA